MSCPRTCSADFRIRAERPGGRPVFVGIGPEREVDAYLRGVAHAEVDDLFDPPGYRIRRGGAPRRPPSAERFWVASTDGSGRQAVSWEVEGGQWTIVAMNADATRGVVLDADVGAKVGWFLGVGIGLVVVGVLLLAAGVALIVGAARRPRGPPRPILVLDLSRYGGVRLDPSGAGRHRGSGYETRARSRG